MRTIKQVVIVLAVVLAGATALPAKNLRYLGKASDDHTRGRVQDEEKSYSVRVGDEIPGWGRVKAVKDEELVVERELTADEKRDREAKGQVAADVEEVHVPNAMRNLACDGDACTQPKP
jgi:hypothetical protein